jgi:hypothetical protein
MAVAHEPQDLLKDAIACIQLHAEHMMADLPDMLHPLVDMTVAVSSIIAVEIAYRLR